MVNSNSLVFKIPETNDRKLNKFASLSFLNSSTSIPLSPDQTRLLNQLVTWLKSSQDQHITVGGYAGTGKTTLIGVLRKLIQKSSPKVKVAFACYTGKASQVLASKLASQQSVWYGDTCGTIHGLMYSPDQDKNGRIISWRKNKDITQDLIIIDEASMVDARIWEDLCSYGIRIIAVGDHGQLPPISADGGTGFNLMKSPQLKLEHIHRQAADNPILQMATEARTTGRIAIKDYNQCVRKLPRHSPEAQELCEEIFNSYNDNTLVLCGYNKTRIRLNQAIRQHLGFEHSEPQAGERVICLKNIYDNESGPIYNGMQGELIEIKPEGEHWYQAEIYFPDEGRQFIGTISKPQFGQEGLLDQLPGLKYQEIGERFDFGYALTVHKAQGSQANRVLLFEESFPKWQPEERSRWLYTAVTRAVEELYVLG